MNARARVIEQGSLFQGNVSWFSWTKEMLAMSVLVVLVLFSALSVVYVKNYERTVFSELQSTQTMRERLQEQWGQLLVEHSAWATPSRVQTLASRHFAMHLPSKHDLIVVGA